jgi:hypothetical protein
MFYQKIEKKEKQDIKPCFFNKLAIEKKEIKFTFPFLLQQACV